MTNARKTLCTMVMSAAFIALPASATGIPVVDVANLAQAVQQLEQMMQQLQIMKQQYQEAQAMRSQLNGVRHMGDLVNMPTLNQYLPSDWNQLIQMANNKANGTYSNLGGSAAALRDTLTYLKKAQNGGTLDMLNKERSLLAVNMSSYQQAMQQSAQRIQNMNTLLAKINDAPDAKDTADLQARIQAEQGFMQNEAIRMQILTQLSEAQNKMYEQQKKEEDKAMGKGTAVSVVNPFEGQ